MKVTFIEHSGFMVEMEQNVLLFDYYQGEIPSFDGSKTLYVFASHSHADHYDPAIWKSVVMMAARRKRKKICVRPKRLWKKRTLMRPNCR